MDNPFDKVVVLAIDKRIYDITIHVEILQALDWFCSVFLCGEGKILPFNFYSFIDKKYEGRSQAKNYGLAFQTIVRDSQEKGHERILFFEDDSVSNPRYVLKDQFENVWEQYLQIVEENKRDKWTNPEYSLIYLGGNVQEAILKQRSENLYEGSYLLDMHALVINRSAFQRILDIEVSDTCTIDGVVATCIKRGELTALTVSPVLFTQKDNYSFNENKFVSRSLNHIL